MHRGLVPRGLLRSRGGIGLAVLAAAVLSTPWFLLSGCGDDSTSPDTTCAERAGGCVGTVGYDPVCDDPGVVCTWAGTGAAGFNGEGKSPLRSMLYWPVDLTITSEGEFYILDWNNHRVRHLEANGTLKTVIGNENLGDGPCAGFLEGCEYSDLVLPGAPGTEISLNHPTELVELPDGRMLMVAWHNHKLRTYDPTTGLVWVMCGRGAGFTGDGGSAQSALLNQPAQVAVSPSGELFILDQRNQRIRRIATDGNISTIAGTGVAGFGGDGGDPLQAQVRFPAGSNPQPAGGIVLDAEGRIYFSDILNHRVRRIDLAANRIDTVVGNGTAGYAGDGGQAVDAQINNPRDLEFGPDGRLYIADEKNNRIRAVDLATGIISTVAGNGTPGFSGDGGPAVEASFRSPSGIAFDASGRLYIADTNNQRIRRVTL